MVLMEDHTIVIIIISPFSCMLIINVLQHFMKGFMFSNTLTVSFYRTQLLINKGRLFAVNAAITMVRVTGRKPARWQHWLMTFPWIWSLPNWCDGFKPGADYCLLGSLITNHKDNWWPNPVGDSCSYYNTFAIFISKKHLLASTSFH